MTEYEEFRDKTHELSLIISQEILNRQEQYTPKNAAIALCMVLATLVQTQDIEMGMIIEALQQFDGKAKASTLS